MKPATLKGTRDFLPEQAAKRNYLFSLIREVFEKYGYAPIETPAMEHLQTLSGKYGDEGDQLLFRILNNGDFLSKADDALLTSKNSRAVVPQISKRAMRYDLTVPFARFVAQHQNDIHFPFKRYQIQPVWRADRPQAGRYQEFYQCDVDVVGSDSLMYEAELIEIYNEVFKGLKIPTWIRINNRKILYGLSESTGTLDHFIGITIAIDKWDKIGEEGVIGQLNLLGISHEKVNKIINLLQSNDLMEWKKALSESKIGLAGVAEIEEVFDYCQLDTLENKVTFDPKLARGLSYYTGCIFEVEWTGDGIGSLGGGGRYDDLTAIFGLKGVSGVGVSFGAERIYDLMEKENLFPDTVGQPVQLFITSLGSKAHLFGYQLIRRMRAAGISADIYPEPAKLGKQLKYASNRKMSQVLILGESEVETGILTLKNLDTGEQKSITEEDLVNYFNS